MAVTVTQLFAGVVNGRPVDRCTVSVETALYGLRLLHINEHIQHRRIDGELRDLVSVDRSTVLKAILLKEAAGLRVNAQLLLLVFFHMGISVNGYETLFKARGQAIIVNQCAVIQAFPRAEHGDGLTVCQHLIAGITHHGLSGAGVCQLLHGDCYCMVVNVHLILIVPPPPVRVERAVQPSTRSVD